MNPSLLKLLKPDDIVEMLELAFQYEKWDKLIIGSEFLHNSVQYIYEERLYHKAKELPLPDIATARPLVYYFGFSHYMRGLACLKLGLYEQAGESIFKYAELGWLQDLDKEGLRIVEEFRNLARSNAYALDMLSGKFEVLKEYAAFLLEYPDELLPGLATILQAAVQYKVNVDEFIHRLVEQANMFGDYWDSAKVTQYHDYCYHMALYRKQARREEEAANYALRVMSSGIPSGGDRSFRKCMALFESLQRKVTKEQNQQYRKIRTRCLKWVD